MRIACASAVGCIAATISYTAVAGEWRYDGGTDPLGGTYRQAELKDNGVMLLDPPYAGAQKPVLVIKRHSSDGLAVAVVIDRGQILCDNYNHRTIEVRFDDKKPTKEFCLDASDGSSDIVFIEDASKILTNITKSKKMVVALEMYHNGMYYAEFDVEGFDTTQIGQELKAKKRAASKK